MATKAVPQSAVPNTNYVIPQSNIPAPATRSYSDIYADAQGKIAPTLDPSIDALSAFAPKVAADASTVAKSFQDQIPFTQNIYSDLAKTLAIQYQQDKDTKTQEKTQALGQQEAEAAKSGFDTQSGFEAAQGRQLANSYDTQIQQITDKYAVSADQLTQEASKDVQTLLTEAAQAIQSGDTEQATIIGKVVDAKVQEQNLITSAAGNILTAQTQDEKAYWQQTYQSAILDVRQQGLDLSAQRLMYTESKGSGGGKSGAKPNIATLTSFGQNLGLDPATAAGIVAAGMQNGASQDDIIGAMQTAISQQNQKQSASKPKQSTSGNSVSNFVNNIPVVGNVAKFFGF